MGHGVMAQVRGTMDPMDLFYLVIVLAVIGGIVGICLLADWSKQSRKRRYNQELAQWQQNEYLRQIAEQQEQATTRQDSAT
jgi:Mg2+/citrate symporter